MFKKYRLVLLIILALAITLPVAVLAGKYATVINVNTRAKRIVIPGLPGQFKAGEILYKDYVGYVNNPTSLSNYSGVLALGGTQSSTTLLKITAKKNYPTSVSTGGMVNITNTLNDGAGLVFVTNHGSGATGRPFEVNCNNSSFDQNCFSVDMQGSAPAISISQSNKTSSIGYAANFASTNPSASSVVVSGYEYGRGTLKITHTGNYLTDAGSAGLSIDLQATSTPTGAKGIYIDSTTGTSTGDFLDIKNYGTPLLTLKAGGNLGIGVYSPTNQLSISTSSDGSIATQVFISNNGTSANTGASIWLSGTSGNTRGTSITAIGNGSSAGNGHALTFSTSPNGGVPLERIKIDSSGYVGIGTSTATVPLQVTTPTANATTTVEMGKSGQNKGTCLKMYNNTGTVTYCSISGTTLSCSATTCQ